MQATIGGAAATLLAALVFAAPTGRGDAAKHQVQAVPGPGSGVVTVTGKVEVVNAPDVGASQRGDWKMDVRVTNTPTVTLAPLSFVKVGGRYEVLWPNGEKEMVRIAELGAGEWIRVESTRPRWVNLAAARSIEAVS
jgi:hypothetical protein